MAGLRALGIATVLAVTAACSGSGSETGTAATDAATKTTERPRATAMVDLCTLVTEAEAEAILGKPLASPQKQPGGDCWYMREGGTDFGAVEFILSIVPVQMGSTAEFDKFVRDQVDEMNGKMKKSGVPVSFTADPASGVGAPAYFIDPGLYVLKGEQILAVGLGGEQGVQIAKTALPRL